jgi:hypothetical protein
MGRPDRQSQHPAAESADAKAHGRTVSAPTPEAEEDYRKRVQAPGLHARSRRLG